MLLPSLTKDDTMEATHSLAFFARSSDDRVLEDRDPLPPLPPFPPAPAPAPAPA